MRTTSKRWLAATAALMVVLGLTSGPLATQTTISADGIIESTSGGFMFPDGSVQSTASGGGTAHVEDTGQTGCWDDQGASRGCSGTGEDGELLAGVPWPTPRFVDNGDGTVTDRLTGLMWLQDADCPDGQIGWQAALDWVASLNSSAIACANYAAMTYDDWRLPNIRELASLVDFGETDPALPAGHPFVSAQSVFYWSSTTHVSTPANAWSVNLATGKPSDSGDKDSFTDSVWPVRGGQ